MDRTGRSEEREGASRRSGKGRLTMAVAGSFLLGALAIWAMPQVSARNEIAVQREPTRVGVNLFGPAFYNRQQVFSNLILQSTWMSTAPSGWVDMPREQLDAEGWVRFLEPGQKAPRMLVLPPAPFREVEVGCFYKGRGRIGAGGVATVRDPAARPVRIDLRPTGDPEEVAWIELVETDPRDPVREIDCRVTGASLSERFSPEFLAFVRQFRTVRFLDWQKTNDNAPVSWADRPTPLDATQAGAAGVSIEDMVDLANQTGANPWFLMPYTADEAYVRQFARLVHERIDPERTVYVELGNEVWNMVFPASAQARDEGLALGLGEGNPMYALMLRYAQKVRMAMRVWTEEFADRPGKLVRVASSQNAWPELAEIMLQDGQTDPWIDALATAPYFGFDLKGEAAASLDAAFARMPGAMAEALDKAADHRRIAARHGKRYLTYEGGQHFVTPDMKLARALQRDPRMGTQYVAYLEQWDARFGGDMMLYASTAPIAHYGSWGLREHGGQPLEQAPKMRAVAQFLSRGCGENCKGGRSAGR